MECFVINLPSDSARRLAISAQLESLGMPFTIFEAVNGKQLGKEALARDYDRAKAIEESHDLTPGELGCALSHLGVYRHMVEKNISHALVLEDDAKLDPALPQVVSKLQALYASETPMVVMLNYVEKYKKWRMKKLDEHHHVVETYGGTPNAHGYFITLAAAKSLAVNLHPIWMVADRWDKFSEKKFIDFRALVPYCVGLTEHAKDSNLNVDRVERMSLYKRGGLYYTLHRFLYKKFIYQLFVRPFQRVATQRQTW